MELLRPKRRRQGEYRVRLREPAEMELDLHYRPEMYLQVLGVIAYSARWMCTHVSNVLSFGRAQVHGLLPMPKPAVAPVDVVLKKEDSDNAVTGA